VDEDLLEIAVKTHRPTLCLVSALARHDLIDQIPSHHDVAVPRGQWRQAVSTAVRWHKLDRATFDVSRTEIAGAAEYVIGLYDAPRSIIDAFRLRHTHLAGGRPAELLGYAQLFPTARPAILNARQILLKSRPAFRGNHQGNHRTAAEKINRRRAGLPGPTKRTYRNGRRRTAGSR
jgi:hypothetical protein